MMKTEFVKKLIDKGAIKRETEVEANYVGNDIAGSAFARSRGVFLVLGARFMEDQIVFDAVDTRWGQKQRINSEDIIRIDGMEPDRFALIFGLNENGDPMKQGARRGRKPKALLEQLAREAQAALAKDEDDDDDIGYQQA
jgi:hypothetical protein